MTGMGAFAEKIVAPEGSVMPIPESMDYETAAALSMTYGTTLYALKQRANLKAGRHCWFLEPQVGLALPLLIWAKLWELKLLQLHHLKKKLICAFNMVLMKDLYPTGDLSKDQQKELSGKIKEVTGGVGANVIYDPVGSHYSEPALRAIAWEGRYLVIGFAAGDIPKIPLNLALLKGCQIVGVFGVLGLELILQAIKLTLWSYLNFMVKEKSLLRFLINSRLITLQML